MGICFTYRLFFARISHTIKSSDLISHTLFLEDFDGRTMYTRYLQCVTTSLDTCIVTPKRFNNYTSLCIACMPQFGDSF